VRQARDYQPRQPDLVMRTFQWSMPDATGRVWESIDPIRLREDVALRNAAIRAEDEAALGRLHP
jgi:hypothetical protein